MGIFGIGSKSKSVNVPLDSEQKMAEKKGKTKLQEKVVKGFDIEVEKKETSRVENMLGWFAGNRDENEGNDREGVVEKKVGKEWEIDEEVVLSKRVEDLTDEEMKFVMDRGLVKKLRKN
jgi:hypothetical protein